MNHSSYLYQSSRRGTYAISLTNGVCRPLHGKGETRNPYEARLAARSAFRASLRFILSIFFCMRRSNMEFW